MTHMMSDIFNHASAIARDAGVFDEVSADAAGLRCRARGPEAHAEYRLSLDAGRLWVSLVTPDRWLSQSIEADLMFTGDKLEDLVEEELVDQGVDDPAPVIEHFRSEDKLFTFRTPLPTDLAERPASEAARIAAAYLFAYEAAFRDLGDMKGESE